MDANDRRSRASEEAAQWWTVLQGAATRAQREQFVDWLRESALHVAEMLRVAQVHGALEQFERWSQLSTDGSAEGDRGSVITLPVRKPAQDIESKGRQTRVRWAAAAAVGMLAVVTAWLLPVLRGQIIQTERGERREVALADGSVVQVDPQSRLRVKFEQATRVVYLERGRALFRVASNPERPFEVRAEGMLVRAIGTAFGVERNAAGLVVTVAEGRVAVRPQNAAAPALTASAPAPSALEPAARQRADVKKSTVDMPLESVLLSAGHQLTVQRSGSAEPVREVNSGRELAWAQGSLVFENDTLADVVVEFNRYNRVQLRVADDALLKRRISAVFEASDLESFLAFIQTAAPVNIERGGDEEITLSLRH